MQTCVAGQPRHVAAADAPTAVLYEPLLHVWHTLVLAPVAVLYWPAAQLEQSPDAESPGALPHVPAGQAEGPPLPCGQ